LLTGTLAVLCAGLAVAEPDPLTLPRLPRGKELVYRGTHTEESAQPGARYRRTYNLETHVFTLDAPARGYDLAFLTVLRSTEAAGPATPPPVSVRLATGRLDLQGKLRAPEPQTGPLPAVPIDGPPALEWGMFVELPSGRLALGQTWDAMEDRQPPCTWRVTGMDVVKGVRCYKLTGVRQSEDWDRPRGDSIAWRRTDTVWHAAQTGLAAKVERLIERRPPSSREPTDHATLTYELASSLVYTGHLYDDRRREIQQATAFAAHIAPLLPKAGEVGPQPFEVLIARIDRHTQEYSPTPYRESVLAVRRQADAGRRGEVASSAPAQPAASPSGPIAADRPAPDFVTTDLATGETIRLSRWRGKPVLLVFYKPESARAADILRFAQGVHQRSGQPVHVAALPVGDRDGLALKQRSQMRLDVPTLEGEPVRKGLGVESTPAFVIIDAAGVVREYSVGWGGETAEVVGKKLERWIGP
jgi:hypothetical protein